MKTLGLLVLFLNLVGNCLITQEKKIDVRYKGKEIELRKFITQNVKYPVSTLNKKFIGYSIMSITITPEGEISDISAVNPLDNATVKDITRILRMTRKNWLKSDTAKENETFYIPVLYVMTSDIASFDFTSPISEKYNFIEPVLVVARSSGQIDLPESTESILLKIDENIRKNEYRIAVENVDELIRRNPFNKELYQLRISMNHKLNKSDLILEDTQKIQNFIPGVSLDKLTKIE